MTLDPMTPAEPTVFLQDGRVLASSRDVARYFTLRHDVVMTRIASLMRDGPGTPCFIKREQTIDMSRFGFEWLCQEMGFGTAQTRLCYLDAFDDMSAVAGQGLGAFSRAIGPAKDVSPAG